MFVRTSGPTVARTSSVQISQPTSQSCDVVTGSPTSAIKTHAPRMTTALTCDGE